MRMIILLAAALLAACSSSLVASPNTTNVLSTKEPYSTLTRSPDKAIGTSTPRSMASSEPTPTPRLTPEENGSGISDPVIKLNQTGGIAGINLTWELYSDGRIIAPGGNQVVVDQRLVTELLERISTLGFFSLEQGKPNAICCDFFTFSLSVTYEGFANTISYSEGDSAAPPIFFETVAEVQVFLEHAMADS